MRNPSVSHLTRGRTRTGTQEYYVCPLAQRENRGDAPQVTLASYKEVGEVTFTSFVHLVIYSFSP